jgi:glycoprotein endo-alpha-1,2-mannosidase
MPSRSKLLFVALLIGSAAALPARGAPAATGPTIARLEVSITTTSAWTQVVLSPGRIAAQRVVSVPSDVTFTSLANGWVLNSPAGKLRTVTLRSVFEEPSGEPLIRVTVRKGSAGATIASIRNTSYAPFQAAYVHNQLPKPSSGTPGAYPYTSVVHRTRQEFFGASDPVLTPVDARPLVLAAYYPWFGPGNYDSPKLADRPLDERSTLEYPGVLSMTQQARASGIDGFVVSWAGEEYSGWRFDLALDAAEATSGYVIPYIEMIEAHAPDDTSGKADPLIVLDWISDALQRADSPALLRSGGVPVVFVYSMSKLSPFGWTNVLTELNNRGTPVRLVGDATLTSNYGLVEWGSHIYNPNFLSPSTLAQSNRDTMLDARLLATNDPTGPHLTVATVSPGYDDTNLRGDLNPIVPRGLNGERYAATWDAALAAQPDWVLITSWNEWFEGTSVEPSVEYGDLALQQTAEQAARFAA